jgi:hypothetical protein
LAQQFIQVWTWFESLICNWNDEHTRRDSSKNTIERRVFLLRVFLLTRRINSFLPEKLKSTSFFKILPRKSKGAKKKLHIINKVIYNSGQWQLREKNILLE